MLWRELLSWAPVDDSNPCLQHPHEVFRENEASLAYTAFGPLQLRLMRFFEVAKDMSGNVGMIRR